MENRRIYPLPEIDNLILQFLDPLDDYKNIMQLNKYYRNIIKNDDIYTRLNIFFQSQHFHQNELFWRDKNYRNYILSCRVASIEITKYLFYRYKIDFNIDLKNYVYFEDIDWNLIYGALYNACMSNNLKTAKWLYDISNRDKIRVNMSFYNDIIFRETCNNEDNLETAKWLCTLDNKYHIEEKDGKIVRQYIR